MQPTRTGLLQNMPMFGAIRDHVLEFLLQDASTVAVRSGEY